MTDQLRALDLALRLIEAPYLAREMRARDLPPDVGLLLEIVAGNQGAIARAKAAAGRSGRHIVAASELFVCEVMLFPGAPHERVLGVRGSATREEMRNNMRLLMLWLHPDHSRLPWHATYASRVLEAWRNAPKHAAAVPATTQPRARRRGVPQTARWVVPNAKVPSRRARRIRRLLALTIILIVLGGYIEYLTEPEGVVQAAVSRLEALMSVAHAKF